MRLAADLTLVGRRFEQGQVIDVDGGRIDGIRSLPLRDAHAADLVRLPGKALLPGTVNTHCHTFQSLLRGLGDDMDFMRWRDRVLYPFSRRLDARGIEIGAAFAFGEMLRHGITTVVDFFYIQGGGNANAEAAIRAAKRVGIRLVLARAFYDWTGAPPEYRETVTEATARCRELMTRYAGAPTVSVQPAP